MQGTRTTRLLGALALAVLAVLGVLALGPPPLVKQPAVVEARQVFRIQSDGSGRYISTLTDGRSAEGASLVHQRVLAFDRNDLVQVQLADQLRSGDRVEQGQPLMLLHSVEARQGLRRLAAEREALQARRELLTAGARPEEIAEAERRVRVARAQRAQGLPELDRTRDLHGAGAVATADLQQAELLDEVRRLEVALAEASLGVARSSARPEALAEIDAQVQAIDAEMAALEDRLSQSALAAPIAGMAVLGGSPETLLSVYDLHEVYLRFPIPEEQIEQVRVGDHVRFDSPGAGGRIHEGTVARIASVPTIIRGRVSFLATARVDNPELVLRAGMTGQVQVFPGDATSLLAAAWHGLSRRTRG